MSGAGYAHLYISHPLFESSKRYPVLQSLLRDQAFFIVQGCTLQLGQVKGGDEVNPGCPAKAIFEASEGVCIVMTVAGLPVMGITKGRLGLRTSGLVLVLC